MKYIPGRADYASPLQSANNFKKALFRIGVINPLKLRSYTLKRNYHSVAAEKNGYTDRQFIRRGILSVYKKLNHGKQNGAKYTINMIDRSMNISSCSSKGDLFYKCTVSKEFLTIVNAVYSLLQECDPSFCKQLLKIEQPEQYHYKTYNNNLKLKSIAPIHTNIYIRANNEQIQEYVNFSKKVRAVANKV